MVQRIWDEEDKYNEFQEIIYTGYNIIVCGARIATRLSLMEIRNKTETNHLKEIFF